MFKKFLPKEHRFFDLFEQQAAVIRRGIDLFLVLLGDYSRRNELTKQLKDIETEADDITHHIYNLLNNTFITPFDREDIKQLVNGMDDVMDLLEKAGSRLEIYNMAAPPDAVRKLTDILQKAFLELSSSIDMLKKPKQRETILEICVRVNSLENEGDTVLRSALKALFEENSHALDVIKLKEIYESLEDAIDRCEDVANVIETILIKNS